MFKNYNFNLYLRLKIYFFVDDLRLDFLSFALLLGVKLALRLKVLLFKKVDIFRNFFNIYQIVQKYPILKFRLFQKLRLYV